MTGPERIRLRIRFSKVGKIRWTSHRDLARMWERAFRRVQLPLAYSEGFSPRPRVSFGLALPTGYESVAEFLDVELTSLDGIALDDLVDRLSAALPLGVDAAVVARLPQGASSLQEEVTSCSWRWMAVSLSVASASVDEVAQRVQVALAADTLEIPRNRKGVEVVEDIRPGLISLAVEGESAEGVVLVAELAAAPRAIRPTDVITAIGPGFEERQVRRTHQWIMRQGTRQEPLVAAQDEAPAPHALERAS